MGGVYQAMLVFTRPRVILYKVTAIGPYRLAFVSVSV